MFSPIVPQYFSDETALPLPDQEGKILLDPGHFGVVKPDTSTKGSLSYAMDIKWHQGREDPLPLIPTDTWSNARRRLSGAMGNHYLFYDKVVTRWVPHVSTNKVYGQLAVVDTRIESNDPQDLFQHALWATGVLDLGKTYRLEGTVPYCIPLHAPQKGRNAEENPIAVLPIILESAYQDEARLGSIKVDLKLAVSRSPIDSIVSPAAELRDVARMPRIKGSSRKLDRSRILGSGQMERSQSLRVTTAIEAPSGGAPRLSVDNHRRLQERNIPVSSGLDEEQSSSETSGPVSVGSRC